MFLGTCRACSWVSADSSADDSVGFAVVSADVSVDVSVGLSADVSVGLSAGVALVVSADVSAGAIVGVSVGLSADVYVGVSAGAAVDVSVVPSVDKPVDRSVVPRLAVEIAVETAVEIAMDSAMGIHCVPRHCVEAHRMPLEARRRSTVARGVCRFFTWNAVEIAVECRERPWTLPRCSAKKTMYIPILVAILVFSLCLLLCIYSPRGGRGGGGTATRYSCRQE